MTTAAHLHLETSKAGRQYLAGTIEHDLPRGSLVHLLKDGDGYRLEWIDPRTGDRTRQSLLSFVVDLPSTPGGTGISN